MVRYMIYMSYIGSRYRGAQKQFASDKVLDIDSIQGALEAGFLTLVPRTTIRPSLTLSSRTDAGVHAMCATGHIELANKYDSIYDSDSVLRWMNRYLTHCGHEIRLTSFFPVVDTFHARYAAQSRTYLYRLLTPKYDDEHKLPISELGHAWHVDSRKFDIDKFRAATRLFMGWKNFETFAGKARTDKVIRYVRLLNELRVEEGEPFMSLDPLSKNFDYWNVFFSARGFLYNQVRRIVGALVAVAKGDITERDVNIMLHVPATASWMPSISVAPPHGLFLKEVTYDPEELARSRIRNDFVLSTAACENQLEARKKSLRATKTIITDATGERYEIVDGLARKLNVRVSPFVVDVKPDMQVAKIVEGLYLSSQDPLTSEELLKAHAIRHILSLGVEPFVKYEGIEYNFIDFLDLPDFDISSTMKECLRVIDRCIRDNVLVHCNAGVSRSATIVIAYLMASEGLTYEESYEKVKSARSCIKPNDGFIRQLRSMPDLKEALQSRPEN